MQQITEPAEFIQQFLTGMTQEVLDGGDHTEIVDRYHTPDVIENADGHSMDRQKLIDHMRPMQKTVKEFRVEVHEAIADGRTLAARLTLFATRAKGEVVVDVAFFGDFAPDGRLRRADQLTSMR